MDPLEEFRTFLDDKLSIVSVSGSRKCTKERLTEADLTYITNLLENGANQMAWAKRPRIFAVLYIIGCIQDTSIMDDFIQRGYTDINLPFDDMMLDHLSSSIARKFRENQKVIFTGAGDLENGKGHQYFHDGDEFYREGSQLGMGAYAYVYEVMSRQSFKKFARKMFPRPRRPAEAMRISKLIADEVEHLKNLSHQHLVNFVGSYTDMNNIAILMEPVARCNLMELLAQSPFPNEDKARLPSYFGCLAHALKYLHGKSVKHKDLKPSNILVSAQGKVLITDFGSATSFWETGQSTTMGPEISMTPEYAPREVIDRQPRSTKADVYSLGCVFFEMWTVWKGESISNMKTFFAEHGTLHENIRDNQPAAAQWAANLTDIPGHNSYTNEPMRYIRRMIQEDPKSRPSMHEIVLMTIGSSQTSRFCCPVCMAQYSDDSVFRHLTVSTPIALSMPDSSPISPSSASAIIRSASAADPGSLRPVMPSNVSLSTSDISTVQPPETKTPHDDTKSNEQIALQQSQGLDLRNIPSDYNRANSTRQRDENLILPRSPQAASWTSLHAIPKVAPPKVPQNDLKSRLLMTQRKSASSSTFAAPDNVSSFKTDDAISDGGNQGQRDLQKWNPDALEVTDGALEPIGVNYTGLSNGWDQFSRGKDRFVTDFDENMYTTTIDKTHPQYKQRVLNAERIAREIETGVTTNSHVAEERVTDNVTVGDIGRDEEDKYSSVHRQQDFPPLATSDKKYTPPAERIELTAFPPVNPQTKDVDTETVNTFKSFAMSQRRNVEAMRTEKAKKDKEARLNELKRFADSFKLQTPIPSDLVSIIAKDPSEQKKIEEAAMQNAQNAPKTPVTREQSYVTRNTDALPAGPLPYLTEVPDHQSIFKAWLMPANFDWNQAEMLHLARLKRRSHITTQTLIAEFPTRSGSNIKKFWRAFCEVNGLRANR